MMKKTINLLAIWMGMIIFNLGALAQTGPGPNGNGLDKGDFKVGFSPITKAKNPKKVMPKEVTEVLQGIATPLNSIIALPHDIFLNFDECGEPNAFYSSATKEITMCYEFLETFEEEFKKVGKNQAEIDNRVDGTLAFFFFHELGHCLIDVWDLPATGREEDAVDQLAMIILLDGTPEGQDMVVSGALFFDLFSKQENPASMIFWDEHSFNKQRFYNTLCLVYGSDPQKNQRLIGPRSLPAERAERCPTEFKRADRAWERLLAPYLKS